MPLTNQEHQHVQDMIDSSSAEGLNDLRLEAEATLSEVNVLMGQKILSKDENKAAEIAVEILTRIEATQKRKGWWFRAKRRVQLTQMYLGS